MSAGRRYRVRGAIARIALPIIRGPRKAQASEGQWHLGRKEVDLCLLLEKGKNMTDLPETVMDCLIAIEEAATSTAVEADKRKRIVRLAHQAERLIGNPNEVMAAKAAHVQTLIAEHVEPAEAIRVAGLDVGC